MPHGQRFETLYCRLYLMHLAIAAIALTYRCKSNLDTVSKVLCSRSCDALTLASDQHLAC